MKTIKISTLDKPVSRLSLGTWAIGGGPAWGQTPEEQAAAEEKILLAEYALDFAIYAADHALLISMEAIEAQLSQQEKEETE